MGNRNMFEELFANRNIVRLDDATELYILKDGNERVWAGNERYRVTVSARPLLFGGLGDAEVMALVRIDAPPSEQSQQR